MMASSPPQAQASLRRLMNWIEQELRPGQTLKREIVGGMGWDKLRLGGANRVSHPRTHRNLGAWVGARVRHPYRTPDSKFVPPHTTHNFSL